MPATRMRVAKLIRTPFTFRGYQSQTFWCAASDPISARVQGAGTRSEARCYFALPLCFCTDNAAKPQTSQALKARAGIDLSTIGCRDLRDQVADGTR
jgi:hypothetical protein